MAKDSAIQWTRHTFNPWRGCSKVHEGCTHCYAEKAMPNVMQKGGPLKWGEVWQGGQRVVAAEARWKEPLSWARAAAKAGERHRVFCASLADVLEVPADAPVSMHPTLRAERQRAVEATREALEGARQKLWALIRETAHVGADGQGRFVPFTPTRADKAMQIGGLDWLLLTKRPENWHLVPADVRPLVWFGTSIADQRTANAMLPELLQALQFRYRFVSIEPLVAPVAIGLMGTVPAAWGLGYRPVSDLLNWVIVGGESGSKARTCNAEWIRSIVKECETSGTPCFVKQLGQAPSFEVKTPTGGGFRLPVLADKKGGDMAEWPKDLRVRQFPEGVLP